MSIFSWKKRPRRQGVFDALDKKQQEYARRIADWMGRQASRIPVRRLRLWVIVVLAALAVVNTLTMVEAIRARRDRAALGLGWIQPARMPPARIIRSPKVRRSLQVYLDSLRRDSVGSKLLDSLLKMRPGLADSLRQAERLGN